MKDKNDIRTNDTITISKIYRFSEIANWLSEGLPLEQYLNFDEAVRIIRIAFKKWLIKEKMNIDKKEKILNILSYTMETLAIYGQIMKEEKEKK